MQLMMVPKKQAMPSKKHSDFKMVHPAGLEPATFSVETSCSIQLSYECVKMVGYHGTAPCSFGYQPNALLLS